MEFHWMQEAQKYYFLFLLTTFTPCFTCQLPHNVSLRQNLLYFLYPENFPCWSQDSEPLNLFQNHMEILYLNILYYIIFSHYIAKFPSLVTTWLGKIRYLPSKELQVSFPHIGAFQSFSDFLFKTETVIKTSRTGGSQSHSRSRTAVRLWHIINWNTNYN